MMGSLATSDLLDPRKHRRKYFLRKFLGDSINVVN